MKSKAKQKAELLSAYQNVFSGADGEKVLLDLMRTHSFIRSTFGKDVNEMLFKEGERHVVLRICSILKMNIKQIKERIELHENDME